MFILCSSSSHFPNLYILLKLVIKMRMFEVLSNSPTMFALSTNERMCIAVLGVIQLNLARIIILFKFNLLVCNLHQRKRNYNLAHQQLQILSYVKHAYKCIEFIDTLAMISDI